MLKYLLRTILGYFYIYAVHVLGLKEGHFWVSGLKMIRVKFSYCLKVG